MATTDTVLEGDINGTAEDVAEGRVDGCVYQREHLIAC